MKLSAFAGLIGGCGTALVASAGCGGADAGSPSSTGLPAPINGVYSLQIETATPSALPKCTSALAGTVAYVSSPSSLWACSRGNWCQISCTTSSAGDVAYASSTQTLVACVSSAWTPVALPKGPQGDAGPPGPPGPTGKQGSQGASGPQGIPGQTGATGATGPIGPEGPTGANGTNGTNGMNGLNGTNGATGPQGAPGSEVQVTAEAPGPNCAAGGERIDVGELVDGGFEIQETAYVCNGLTPEAGTVATPDAGPDSSGNIDAGVSTSSTDDATPSGDSTTGAPAYTTPDGAPCGLESVGCLTVSSPTFPNANVVYNDGFGTATFAWNVPFSDCTGFYYIFDQTPAHVPTPANATFTTATTLNLTVANFAAGTNYLHLVPVDAASNVGTVESTFAVQINEMPPVLTSPSNASQTAWSTNQSVFFGWTFPQGDANAGGIYYVLDQDGATVPTSVATFLPTSQHQVILMLDSGISAFHAVSVDSQGYLTRTASRYRVLIGAAPGVGGVLGTVTATGGAAIGSATVTINHGLLAPDIVPDQTTTASGAYSFNSQVPAGAWTIDVTAPGYQPAQATVNVTNGMTSGVNFTLSP
jgi:hypothetical protein